MTRMFSRTAIAALALVTFAACADKDADTSATTTETTTEMAPPPPAAPVMTDANILSALMSADSMEIELGKAIKAMGSDAGLKVYGATLVTAHGQHAKDVAALATKDSIMPSAMMGDTTMQHVSNMKSMMSSMTKGAATDSAFVAEAINGHQVALDQLNAAEGAAQNADVKAMVTATKPVVQAHLDAAKALQEKMKK